MKPEEIHLAEDSALKGEAAPIPAVSAMMILNPDSNADQYIPSPLRNIFLDFHKQESNRNLPPAERNTWLIISEIKKLTELVSAVPQSQMTYIEKLVSFPRPAYEINPVKKVYRRNQVMRNTCWMRTLP